VFRRIRHRRRRFQGESTFSKTEFQRGVSLPGPWVRGFLLEHLATERNLARNTQRSYRDTPLRLLLPFIAEQARNPVDQLLVVDVLFHPEQDVPLEPYASHRHHQAAQDSCAHQDGYGPGVS
jgi:hypothetical protein